MEGALLMLNGKIRRTGDEDKVKLRCAVARATQTTFN